MSLPFPLTNTFPAMMIFFLAIGLIESDGLFCLIASFVAALATCVYTVVFYLTIVNGVDYLSQLKNYFYN